MEKIRKYLFFITVSLVVIMFSVINNGVDRDLWHRLAVGSVFSHLGHVLHNDIFSYTPVKPLWIDHEWLSGVVFYFMAHNFGDIGLLGLKIIVFLIIILLVFRIHRLIFDENSKYRILYYILSIIAVLPAFVTNVRSQIFTYLFFTLWLYLLERIKRGENRLIWIFPATMVLWANMHGGFLAGIGLVLIYITGEWLNRNKISNYLIILLLTTCATLINPYGIKLLTYLFTAVTMPRPYIHEWYPFSFSGPAAEFLGFKIFFIIAALCLFLRFKKINNWTELLLLTITLLLSLKHQRHMVFFSIVASVYCYSYLYSFIDPCFLYIKKKIQTLSWENLYKLSKFGLETAIYSFLIGVSILIISSSAMIVKVNETDYPVKAIEFIRINDLKGNILSSFNWGSYLLWQLFPNNKVSLDGRYEEIYTDKTYMDVTNFTFARNNWDIPLQNFHNDIILVPSSCETFKKLMTLNKWKIIYKDKYAAILIPSEASDKKYILPEQKDYSRIKYAVPLNNKDLLSSILH